MIGMIPWITILFGLANPSSAWDQHIEWLHEDINQKRGYEARRQLGFLKALDRERFESLPFALAKAKIFREEGNPVAALRYFRSLDSDDLRVRIEEAETLAEAKLFVASNKLIVALSKRVRGSSFWRLRLLEANNQRALAQTRSAIKSYERLLERKAPTKVALTAHYALAELYYDQGDRPRARRHVRRLQKEWSLSDEALASIQLQDERENEAYLDDVEVAERVALTAFRNRDYDRSNQLFHTIASQVRYPAKARRAAYFLGLTHLKQERPKAAVKAFEELFPGLGTEFYHGQAAFQYARALFSSQMDRETIQFCDHLLRRWPKKSWTAECVKYLILSLRRQNELARFQNLERRFRRLADKRDLIPYYHRHGVAWAMQRKRADRALYHLNHYRRTRLSSYEKAEANLWEGLIHWEQGDVKKAFDRWLKVAFRDPNHYFGLTARSLLERVDPGYHFAVKPSRGLRAKRQTPRQLLATLYLEPGSLQERKAVRQLTNDYLPWVDVSLHYRKLDPDEPAYGYAEVGRFDLAAEALNTRSLSAAEVHFLKASWYQRSGLYFKAMSHAELLAGIYPKWLPYELMPKAVQRLIYPLGFEHLVREKASRHRVDPYLLLAIIREESRFNSDAKSWASARGLMQFIPSTAQTVAEDLFGEGEFDLARLYHPEVSIHLGARYVSHLLDELDHVPEKVVAAYNAGELVVHRWSSYLNRFEPLPFVWEVSYSETKQYCQKVLRAYHHYTRVYDEAKTEGLFPVPDWKLSQDQTIAF